ncbi:MAG: hypothetical protein ACOC9T_03300, partial [Myxococcota bacterium]
MQNRRDRAGRRGGALLHHRPPRRRGHLRRARGTGDLVFLNDLFPKDWRSFLLGRDLDYLKAPS